MQRDVRHGGRWEDVRRLFHSFALSMLIVIAQPDRYFSFNMADLVVQMWRLLWDFQTLHELGDMLLGNTPHVSFFSPPRHLADSSPSCQTAEQSPHRQRDHARLCALPLQVFKMNANVEGILKLVDQPGTAKDSATLWKSLYSMSPFLGAE